MISLLPGIQHTAAALTAGRARLDIISENIANAHTTHGPDGKPYQRKLAVFASELSQAMGNAANDQPTLRIARVEHDPRAGEKIYSPGHPDADSKGMVTMPNVNIQEEMADMISASRAFEANLALVRTARTLAMQTLAIGKR
jgi:flagellar basal-body rod protein FlgC